MQQHTTAREIVLGGERLLYFGGCSYLGLAHHPDVVGAARRVLDEDGVSSAASRETSGTHREHVELEEALREYLEVEAVVVTTDGYLADIAVAQALASGVYSCWMDAGAHPGLLDAAAVAGFEVRDYRPDDLPESPAPAIFTDSGFPSSGRLADLPGLLGVLEPEGWLLVDDSHGLGVLGEGRGVAHHWRVRDSRLIVTGSLSKAIGCAGGFVAGPTALVEAVRRTPAFVGTTPVPPAMAAAARVAVAQLSRDRALWERLDRNRQRLHEALPGGESPFPVRSFSVPSETERREVAARIRAAGIFIPHLDYPGSPAGSFRVVVNAAHTDADLDRLTHLLHDLSGPLRAE